MSVPGPGSGAELSHNRQSIAQSAWRIVTIEKRSATLLRILYKLDTGLGSLNLPLNKGGDGAFITFIPQFPNF